MKGGYGGNDIWYVKKIKRDEWSEPVNMGNKSIPVATGFSPLFTTTDHYTFLQMDVGMGGLDIFKAEFDEENVLRSIINMKSPINSSNDDFGIIFENEDEKGYLSSNRLGSKGDDIYQFYLPKLDLTLSGVVLDSKTEQIIEGVLINIVGSDGSKSCHE